MTLRKTSLILIISTISFLANSQPGGGDPGGGGKPVPITGVEFLLIAGGVLGARKLLDRRNSN